MIFLGNQRKFNARIKFGRIRQSERGKQLRAQVIAKVSDIIQRNER